MLANAIIYGFVNSVILMLVALGFNITFGISGIANFAYGALYIMGALSCWVFFNSIGLPYFLAVILAVAATAIAGALMYRFVLLRIRGLVLSEVIATFGIGLALLELFKYIGFIGFQYSLPVFIDTSIHLGRVVIDLQRIFIVIIGICMAGFLWFFTHHTRTGLRFRGIAQDERTALSLGINSDRVAMLSGRMHCWRAGINRRVGTCLFFNWIRANLHRYLSGKPLGDAGAVNCHSGNIGYQAVRFIW
jgi:branched-chain amino acid transport system permease protein